MGKIDEWLMKNYSIFFVNKITFLGVSIYNNSYFGEILGIIYNQYKDSLLHSWLYDKEIRKINVFKSSIFNYFIGDQNK